MRDPRKGACALVVGNGLAESGRAGIIQAGVFTFRRRRIRAVLPIREGMRAGCLKCDTGGLCDRAPASSLVAGNGVGWAVCRFRQTSGLQRPWADPRLAEASSRADLPRVGNQNTPHPGRGFPRDALLSPAGMSLNQWPALARQPAVFRARPHHVHWPLPGAPPAVGSLKFCPLPRTERRERRHKRTERSLCSIH